MLITNSGSTGMFRKNRNFFLSIFLQKQERCIYFLEKRKGVALKKHFQIEINLKCASVLINRFS